MNVSKGAYPNKVYQHTIIILTHTSLHIIGHANIRTATTVSLAEVPLRNTVGDGKKKGLDYKLMLICSQDGKQGWALKLCTPSGNTLLKRWYVYGWRLRPPFHGSPVTL